MTNYPHLVFVPPAVRPRPISPVPRSERLHVPSVDRQIARLESQIADLERAFELERARFQSTAIGTSPEQVLVLEIAGSISDFARAVSQTGIHWLAEWDIDDIEADDDFYNVTRGGNVSDSAVARRIYLIMMSQLYVNTLTNLWNRWKKDPSGALLSQGFKRWRDVFGQLRAVRLWDVEDRIHETGLAEVWRENLLFADEPLKFEVEFWFHDQRRKRQEVVQQFVALLDREGGRLVGSDVVVQEIGYHGALAEVPPSVAEKFVDDVQSVLAFHFPEIMLIKPTGQFTAPLSGEDTTTIQEIHGVLERRKYPPTVAILDGLPIENHHAYADRLVVDDPDGWSASYPVDQRQHGTAMASLVVRGDLGKPGEILPELVYCRPILRPDGLGDTGLETLPEDVLQVDLIHSAVRRLFEDGTHGAPIAPSVRIINLSLGDRRQMFTHRMSPLARLLDWLSWKYEILFIVSAGNHHMALEVEATAARIRALDGAQRDRLILQAIHQDGRHRRLLAPAEAMNAVTVGALHADESQIVTPGSDSVLDPISTPALPSPYSGIGHGYRGSVKPDVLAPGGRQLYRESLTPSSDNQHTVLEPISNSLRPPGIRVAAPGAESGDLASVKYTRGTSNATALTTRAAAILHNRLDTLLRSVGADQLTPGEMAAAVKALLVHSASWADGSDPVQDMLKSVGVTRIRSNSPRLLGYGQIRPELLEASNDYRVTVFGFGSIEVDSIHDYELPLPPSLSSQAVERQLTVTLAWLSPINPFAHRYRRAVVSLLPTYNSRDEGGNIQAGSITDDFGLERKEVSSDNTVRGTVQHEVFAGKKAAPFMAGDSIALGIQCREDAGEGHLEGEEVPYTIVCTIEVPESSNIKIYQEIQSLVRTPIRDRVRQVIQSS